MRNAGPTATGPWYDAVYLSLDDTLDRGSDVYLGYRDSTDTLAAGAEYTGTLTGVIPAGLTGTFTAFVVTDGGNRITPEADEDNNVGSAPGAVVLTLQPPADLVAGTVTIPATATPGQPVTVTYSVTNAGANPAVGSWFDNLFLSTDDTWDLGDAFLGKVLHTGDVAGGASYTETLTAALPGVTPGTYKLIVRTDVRNQVRETNDANNTFASLDRFSVDVPALTLGTAATGTLADGQVAYYRVDVAAGEALLVTLDMAATDGSTELYARFGEPASPTAFDVRNEDVLGIDQRALVGRTQAGTYYILVRGTAGLPSGGYTLTAKTVQFSVFDTSYGKGGTAGNRTIEINGAKFDRTVTAELVNPAGAVVATATDYYRVSDAKLYATFNLTAVTPGSYDVRFKTASGKTTTVANGMEVVRGGGADVKVVVDAPDAIVRPRTGFPFVDTLSYQFHVYWSNSGLNDAPAPVLNLTSTDEFGFSMAEIVDGMGMQDWTFYAASTTGPTGVLPAGAGGVLRLTTRNSDIPIPYIADIHYELTRLYKDEKARFDWDPSRDDLRDGPGYGLSDADFELAFARLGSRVATNGDYLRMLARHANQLGVVRNDLQPLLDAEFEEAVADVVTTSVRGTASATDFAVVLAGADVTARNTTTGDVFFGRMNATGGFTLTGLTTGTYRFEVAGAVVAGDPTFALTAGLKNQPVALTLVPGATFSGRVQTDTGVAVNGAQVQVIGNGVVETATTGADGKFAIPHLPDGDYSVTVTATGRATVQLSNVAISGDGLTRTFILAAEGVISGRVTREAGGPNSALRVAATPTDGSPGAYLGTVDGDTFTVHGLPAGEYTLSISADGYLTTSRALTVTAGGALDAGTVPFNRAGSISGAVTAAAGLTLGGIEVSAKAGGQTIGTALTDGSGRFSIPNLPAGRYELRAGEARGLSTAVEIDLESGEVRSSASVPYTAGAELTGRVRMGTRPAVWFEVSLVASDGASQSAVTDADGVYRFDAVGAGTYTIKTGIAGRGTVDVTTASGVVTAPDISMTESATLTGVVRRADGGGGADATVGVYANEQLVAVAVTAADGTYSLTLDGIGPFTVVARADRGSFNPTADVLLQAGAGAAVDFTSGSASATVLLTGTGVAGLKVRFVGTLNGADFPAGDGVTDESGAVTFAHLVPGTYRAEVTVGQAVISGVLTVTSDGGSLSIALPAVHRVQGQATGNGTSPGEGVVVLIDTSDPTAVFTLPTDAAGRFDATDIPTGTYSVHVQFPGYVAVRQPDIRVASTTTLAILLVPNLMSAASAAAGTFTASALERSAWTNYWTDAEELEAEKVQLELPEPAECPSPKSDAAYKRVQQAFKVMDLAFEAWQSELESFHYTTNLALGDVGIELGKLALDAVSFATGLGSLRGLFTLAKGSGRWADIVLTTLGVFNNGHSTVSFFKDLPDPLNMLEGLPAWIGQLNTGVNVLGQMADAGILLYRRKAEILALARNNLDLLRYEQFLKGIGQLTGVISIALDIYSTGKAAYEGFLKIREANDKVNAAGDRYFEAVEKAKKALDEYDRVREKLGDEAKVNPDHYRTSKNHALNISPRGVLSNDIGVECGDLFVNSWGVGPIVGGALITFNRQGGFRFQPDTDFVGEASFNYIAYRKVDGKPSVVVGQGHVTIEVTKDDKCEGDSCEDSEHRGSADPNDIIGPSGYGDEKWVGVNDPLPYTVRFENDPLVATAPAQVVRITQTLDSDLDARTFRLGDFGFGDLQVDVPDNRSAYQTRLDLREKFGIFVDVIAGVNVATAEVFWELRSVDPATGDVPGNPLVGLLPPNSEGSGQGFVSYTVKAKKSAETGTRIDAQARIVFDINEPIDTPPIFNTIDARPPEAVTPTVTPPTEVAAGIPVSWAANDDSTGVGVRDYTVYVTDTTRPAVGSGVAASELAPADDPVVWLRDTDATGGVFYGLPGHTYTFTVVARDLAGNTATAAESDPVTVLGDPDAAPPTSSVSPLPAESESRFLVSWAGDDGDGSGVAGFDVYVSVNGGAFARWQTGTTATSAYFTGELGRTYSFFSVATDRAGNVQPMKTAGDTTTVMPDPTAEPLEPGGISGTLYEDLNADGERQADEPALGGWAVFVDENGNGTRDEGEQATTAGEDGRYTFTGLPPGTHTVAAEQPAGWLAVSGLDAVGAFAAVADVATPVGTPASDADALIGLTRLRADAGFTTADGRGTSVVFLDTGVANAGGAFGADANGDGTPDGVVYQYDFVDADAVAQDLSGHGTGVAALARRVAPGADVIVLRVLDAAGRGDFAVVEKGLKWVAENAARYNIVAVNLSFGDGTGRSLATAQYGLDDEFAALAAKGVLVVAAAGNNHAVAAGVAYPAADPNVLAVGAVYAADRGSAAWGNGAKDYTSAADRIASFSQRDAAGATLFAPGAFVSTVGTSGAAVTLSGTSAATPQVTGAVAVAQQIARETLGRFLTVAELQSLLFTSGTAVTDGDDEQDNVTNTGQTYRRLDVSALARAVRAFVPGETPTPLAPGTTPGQPGTRPTAAFVGRSVVVAPGATTADADLGFYRPAEIAVTVFDDADADGTQSDGEGGRSGVVVFLDANANGTRDDGEAFTTTAEDGTATFADLKPGTFRLGVEPPSGTSLGGEVAPVMVTSGATGARAVAVLPVTPPPPPADTTPPAVSATWLQNGETQRSRVNRMTWTFDEAVNVPSLIRSGDITRAFRLLSYGLNGKGAGELLTQSAAQFQYDEATRTLTWSLDGSLADGYYEWQVYGSLVTDAAGNKLNDGRMTTQPFHRLLGDLNGDGAVDAADQTRVNAALGSRPGSVAWDADADLDVDGVVTARDRKLLAQAVGKKVIYR